MAIVKASPAPISAKIDAGLSSAFWFMGAFLTASPYFSWHDGRSERRIQGSAVQAIPSHH
jgi:hypothetical protein